MRPPGADDRRPSPEEFLRRIALEERLQARGRLGEAIDVPAVLQRRPEVVLVGRDAPPSAVVRLERQLSELRELALVLAAEVVDHQLEDYLRRAGIEQVYGTHERILVCITPRSSATVMIRRGRRQADRATLEPRERILIHVTDSPATSGSPLPRGHLGRTIVERLAR